MKAVVAGALGLVGRNMATHLAAEGWPVVGLSRSVPAEPPGFSMLAVDLADAGSCRERLAELEGVTHLFYCARLTHPDPAAEAALNARMLSNQVEALEAASPGLRHVQLVHGTKWYGSHLGLYRTPAREDDPRHQGTNFYYDQQDWVAARDAGWGWSTVRPHIVAGFSLGYPHNLIAVLGIYAALCKAGGLPLCFPGTEACYNSLSQVTEIGLLNRAMLWAATTPACAGQAFNIVNDDYFRWRNLWPAIAGFFGMEPGPVRPRSLAETMAGKGALWDRVVAEHGLLPLPYEQAANWRFGDFLLSAGWDDLSSTVKARQHGFVEAIASETAILGALQQFREARVIP